MRFFALDAWRGVCALMVALLHLEVFGHFYSVPLVRHSFLFVDFFFVLSGFVMAHAYGDQVGRWPAVGHMMIRRFGRLWPLHVATLCFFVLVEVARATLVYGFHWLPGSALEFTSTYSLRSVFTQLLLMNSWGFDSSLTWNGPSWSIGAEFYTYFIFGALVVLTRQQMIAASIAIAIFGAALVGIFSPNYMDATYDFGFFRCLYGFFIGQLTYALYRRGSAHPLPNATLCEASAIFAVVVFVSIAAQDALSLAAPLVFAAAVYVFAFQQGAISSLLSRQVFERLGTWSYSIYMVHALIADTLARTARQVEKLVGFALHSQTDGNLLEFGSRFLMDTIAVAYLLVVIGVASLTFRFIEAPGRRSFNSLAGRRTAESVTVPSGEAS